jgi:hypothetical protein
MILGELSRMADTAVTLDDLFRRVGLPIPTRLPWPIPLIAKISPTASRAP